MRPLLRVRRSSWDDTSSKKDDDDVFVRDERTREEPHHGEGQKWQPRRHTGRGRTRRPSQIASLIAIGGRGCGKSALCKRLVASDPRFTLRSLDDGSSRSRVGASRRSSRREGGVGSATPSFRRASAPRRGRSRVAKPSRAATRTGTRATRTRYGGRSSTPAAAWWLTWTTTGTRRSARAKWTRSAAPHRASRRARERVGVPPPPRCGHR